MKMELIMCNIYKLWSCVVCVLFLLAKQVGSYHISVQSKCEDVYIWYGDGSVDCDYLITPSNYGLHKKQRYFCTQYPLTRCCETCAFLRRHDYTVTNGVRRPSGITSLPSTPKQSGHQSQTDITHLPSTPKQSGVRIQSVFTHVPITPKRPDKILFTVPTSRQEITTRRSTRAKPTTTAQPTCEDSYIWLFDGRVDCQFLSTPTVYGLHTNQRFYCVEYPFTRCCHTCDLLRTYNYDYINGAYNQITQLPNTTTEASTTQPTTVTQTLNTITQQTVSNQDMFIPTNILSRDVLESIPPSAAKIVLQLTGSTLENSTQPTTKLPAALHRTIKMFFNALVTMHTNKPSHHLLHEGTQTSQTPRQTTTVKTTTRTTTTTPVPTTTTTTPVPTTTTTTPVPTTTTTTPVPTTTTTTTPVPTTTTTTPVPTTTTTTPVPTTTTTTPVPTTTTTTPVPTTTTTTPVPTTTTTTPVPTTTTTTPVPTTTTTTPVPTTTTTTPVPTTTTTTPVPTTTTTTPVPTTTTTTTPVPTTTTTTPVPTTTTTTPVPTTTTKATRPSTKRVTVPEPKVMARPDCVDVGIWIISGSVGCDYLEKDNKYGLNKNQMYFCLRYPLTSCCETCARIIQAHKTHQRIKP